MTTATLQFAFTLRDSTEFKVAKAGWLRSFVGSFNELWLLETEGLLMSLVDVVFDGNKRVRAQIKGHDIATDQSVKNGGGGEAPEPFELFLASIATCAGYYAKSFCDQRNLGTDGMTLSMDLERGDGGLLSRLDLVLRVAPDFPKKYVGAISRSMGLCSVKKQLREEIATEIRVEWGA